MWGGIVPNSTTARMIALSEQGPLLQAAEEKMG